MTAFKRNFTYDEDIIKTVASNIRKYRKEKNITQEQLAVDIGVSPEFYRKFESTLGSEGISLINVYKISIVLDISIENFFNKNTND
jgi:transcriptional regulator with XRE-family HTH domain